MKIFRNLIVTFVFVAAIFISVPAFAVTATIDVDKVLFEYTKFRIKIKYLFKIITKLVKNIVFSYKLFIFMQIFEYL